MKYLIDSNIIIYHLNGENLATDFLIANKNQCAISQITYIEVLSFAFTPEQEQDVKEFLESFNIVDVNREVSIQATRNRKIKKMTRNSADFNELTVEILDIFAAV